MFLALRIASASDTLPAPPAFDSLRQAVAFIAECLETKDRGRLEAATLMYQVSDLEYVSRLNARYPLLKLYAGREFPQGGKTFVLGGHRSELGHTHIDFKKRDGRWYIHSITMCR